MDTKIEVHIMFMCQKILFFWFFLQSLKNIKIILSSQAIPRWLISATGCSLLIPHADDEEGGDSYSN